MGALLKDERGIEYVELSMEGDIDPEFIEWHIFPYRIIYNHHTSTT